jgi:hypothetical protein
MNHIQGPKLTVFKYSPKKRIRVKGGHRQQYTRLMVDVIGKPGETRKAPRLKKEAPAEEKVERRPKESGTAASSPKGKETALKRKQAEKAPAKKSLRERRQRRRPAPKRLLRPRQTRSSVVEMAHKKGGGSPQRTTAIPNAWALNATQASLCFRQHPGPPAWYEHQARRQRWKGSDDTLFCYRRRCRNI